MGNIAYIPYIGNYITHRQAPHIPTKIETTEMKSNQIIPAAPGTKIVWHNHCLNKTIIEAVLFWRETYEEDHPTPHLIPLVFRDGTIYPFRLSEREFPEGDPRHDTVSSIIACDIPGCGRIEESCDWHLDEKAGYHPSLGSIIQTTV